MTHLRLVLFLAPTLVLLVVLVFVRARAGAVTLDETVWHDYPLGRVR